MNPTRTPPSRTVAFFRDSNASPSLDRPRGYVSERHFGSRTTRGDFFMRPFVTSRRATSESTKLTTSKVVCYMQLHAFSQNFKNERKAPATHKTKHVCRIALTASIPCLPSFQGQGYAFRKQVCGFFAASGCYMASLRTQGYDGKRQTDKDARAIRRFYVT